MAEQLAASVLGAQSAEALESAIRVVLRRPAVQRALAKDNRLISHVRALALHDGHPWQATSLRLLGALGQYPQVDTLFGRRRMMRRAPISDHGVRVLALDGGGTRALLTIEMLRALEAQTGKKVHELFDVVGGTSTGGLLAAGIQERMSLDTLEQLYLELAKDVFVKTTRTRRYGQLLLTGATYKAHALEQILKRVLPGSGLEATANALPMFARADKVDEGLQSPHSSAQSAAPSARASDSAPLELQSGDELPWFERRMLQAEREYLSLAFASSGRVPPLDASRPSPPIHAFVVTSLTSRAPPTPFLLRNYEYAPFARVRHRGTSLVPLWQALRATTAAPSYFTQVMLHSDFVEAAYETGSDVVDGDALTGKLVLQDGALLANNPAAIALQEARALYPGVPIACVASFGTGSFAPSVISRPNAWASTVDTLVKAATRTEEVHEMLADILPNASVSYFRFNPEIPNVSLDETSVQKLKELQRVGAEFMTRGDGLKQCNALAQLLQGRRGAAQRFSSWRAKVFSKLGNGMAIARCRL